MRPFAVLAAVLPLLAACQTGKAPPPPDVMAAACLSHGYLRSNGFLDVVPEGRVVLLDSDLRYETDGVLDYPQLVKDRHKTFQRKLLGVWTATGFTKYRVMYGVSAQRDYCVGVTEDFSFAYMRKSCEADGAFVEIRERNLRC